MKIGVAIDGDGHFQMAKLHEREKVLIVLKSIMDGDYYENEKESDPDEYWSEEVWEEWVGLFIQRGTFDILEL